VVLLSFLEATFGDGKEAETQSPTNYVNKLITPYMIIHGEKDIRTPYQEAKAFMKKMDKAGIKYKGHTEVLRDIFKKEAIMMLGCEKLYVALFTEHIPLKEVPKKIKKEKLIQFFLDFHKSTHFEKVGVLGLNPHAGDGGVLGDEEIKEILPAIIEANEILDNNIFYGPLVPDIAFKEKKGRFIAMYHDQGLAPLKALYFNESINVSLNLPILRTSVDHGTAFDIAYKGIADTKSYENAIKYIIKHKN
jgi:4-hydroxy-L-threonine phosphate dehydrogenase PdxA